MKISLIVPDVNHAPTHRPRACVYCEEPILHRHGTVTKPVRDHKLDQVIIQRYKCVSCGRTFRHYPAGITQKSQSMRTVVLAALMYGLGLSSCSAASHLLGALGCEIAKMSVWRDAQEAGEALLREKRRRPAGRVRVIGADETVYKVKGKEVVVGFVVDAQNGRTLGFEVLVEGDAKAFREWLEPYARELGAEILVTDDNDSYGISAAELGLEHQLCLAHVRKYVAKRSKSILEQAEREWKGGGGGRLAGLRRDLGRVKQLVDELKEEDAEELRRLHLAYLWARPPDRGQSASAGYRMRMLTLELWNKWGKLRVHLARPELGLDGTNNATERAIGRSKVRYKTMRGYKKSEEGMSNGIALTQWLYSGEDEVHDLMKQMAA